MLIPDHIRSKSGYIEELHILCINVCDVDQEEEFHFWHITYIYFAGDIYWCGSDGYGYIIGQSGDWYSEERENIFLRVHSLDIVTIDEEGHIVLTSEKDDCMEEVKTWYKFKNFKKACNEIDIIESDDIHFKER